MNTKFRWSSSFLVLMALSGLAWCAELKCAHYNSEVIVTAIAGPALKDLNASKARWQTEAKALQKAIADRKEAAKNPFYSTLRRDLINHETDSLQKVYNTFLKRRFSSKGEGEKADESIIKPVIDKINHVVDSIGRAEQFVYIFDTRKGTVAFANPSLTTDLTGRILSAFRAQRVNDGNGGSAATSKTGSGHWEQIGTSKVWIINDPANTQTCANAEVIDRKEFESLLLSQTGENKCIALKSGYYIIGGRCYMIKE